jgi:hypothetical protein
MALLTKNGYGQVEPNHLSAQRNKQIYAQLPADPALTQVENGMFLKYDMAAGEMNTDGDGEFMLVYSEIKLYDNKHQGYKDFVLKASESSDGKIYPRLFKTMPGDHFTTNLVDVTSAEGARKGKKFTVSATGVLTENATPAAGAMVWQCVKETTMPDGQKALKLLRIA